MRPISDGEWLKTENGKVSGFQKLEATASAGHQSAQVERGEGGGVLPLSDIGENNRNDASGCVTVLSPGKVKGVGVFVLGVGPPCHVAGCGISSHDRLRLTFVLLRRPLEPSIQMYSANTLPF